MGASAEDHWNQRGIFRWTQSFKIDLHFELLSFLVVLMKTFPLRIFWQEMFAEVSSSDSVFYQKERFLLCDRYMRLDAPLNRQEPDSSAWKCTHTPEWKILDIFWHCKCVSSSRTDCHKFYSRLNLYQPNMKIYFDIQKCTFPSNPLSCQNVRFSVPAQNQPNKFLVFTSKKCN